MGILNLIAYKNVKKNRKRSIASIIGIALSIALIIVVAATATSFKESIISNTRSNYGDYHVNMNYLNNEQKAVIESNRSITNIKTLYYHGTSLSDDRSDILSPEDNLDIKTLGVSLIQGNYITNENEVLINDTLAKELNYEFGSEIKIATKSLTKETYTVVGIVSIPGVYNNTIIISNLESDLTSLYLSFNNPADAETLVQDIVNSELFKGKVNYSFNDELINIESNITSDSSGQLIIGLTIIVVIIILFASIVVIKNAFEISLNEKIKLYSILASIGSTKKQINALIYNEVKIIGFIGISLGLVLGNVVAIILVFIINNFIGINIDGFDELSFSFNVIANLVSILIGIFAIFMSAHLASRKIKKMNLIDQLKNVGDTKVKKFTTPAWVEKYFKIGGVLAYRNNKRSKQKYRVTIIALTLSIAMFITLSTFVKATTTIAKLQFTTLSYSLLVDDFVNGLEQSFIDEVNAIPDVTNVTVNYFPEYSDIILNNDNNFCNSDITPCDDLAVRIIGLNDKDFKQFAIDSGLDYNTIQGKGVLVDNMQDENGKFIRKYTYSENDILKGKYNGQASQIKIAGVSTNNPTGLEAFPAVDGMIVVNINDFSEFNFVAKHMSVTTDNSYVVADKITSININTNVINLQRLVDRNNAVQLIVMVFSYGFLSVISLIGATSVFNTINANMILRSKDFAVLKSIGMTSIEFKQMNMFEIILYCTKALIYGIIIGVLGSITVHTVVNLKFVMAYNIPVTPIIIAIVVTFIFVTIIMRYSMKIINKHEVIATIKQDNI